MLSQLDRFKDKLAEWSKDNDWMGMIGMDEKQQKAHAEKMKEKYGLEFIGFRSTLKDSGYYDYKILIDAIIWLRFWAEKGHAMHAWW